MGKFRSVNGVVLVMIDKEFILEIIKVVQQVIDIKWNFCHFNEYLNMQKHLEKIYQILACYMHAVDRLRLRIPS